MIPQVALRWIIAGMSTCWRLSRTQPNFCANTPKAISRNRHADLQCAMRQDQTAGRYELPIADPHQHFWDLGRNYHPWLCDPVPIAFRYGDYSAIRRNYLPADYGRDTPRSTIVKTVHIEAEWDRADPVGETRWIEKIHQEFGLPSACIGHAQPDRPDVAEVLAGHARSPLVRGIRHKPAASNPREARG